MVVGITGKYCSGKSFIADILEARSFAIADVDAIGHEILAEKQEEVAGIFGIDALFPDGSVNRGALGKIVFSNREKLRRLEALLHPAMKSAVKAFVEKHADAVISAALLFPMGLAGLCDIIITVEAPLLLRVMRAKKRDNLSYCGIIKRIWVQRKIPVKNEPGPADRYIIRNSGDEAEMVIEATKRITAVIESLRQRKQEQ